MDLMPAASMLFFIFLGKLFIFFGLNFDIEIAE